jgi:hypothetical protein
MIESLWENRKEVYLIMKHHGFKVLDINIHGKVLNILFSKNGG